MNIILIITDTFRYDNLFQRAEVPVRTPHLDAFSERAVSVERMIAGSFPTIPHRTDTITGRFGWPWYGWQNLAASSPNNLPAMLRKQGYVSQLICDCPHLFRTGFQRTFDAAVQNRGQESDAPLLRMNHPIEEQMPPHKTRGSRHFRNQQLVNLHKWVNRDWQGEEDRFPAQTARTTVRWLEENYRFDPFFLWVDFFDPHEPWDPPEYMVRRYDPDYTGTPMLHPNYGRADGYTAEELRNLRAHYCAESELVDRWIGRVLEKIDDLGLWDNTVVMITADHGICTGDHNRTGKGNIHEDDSRMWPLYPEIARVPFLVAAPGLPAGRSLDVLAQPADILPTAADLAGVDIDLPEAVHGHSLAPLLRGETDAPVRDCAICASHLRKRDGAVRPEITTPMLYTDRWMFTPLGSDGTPELYDAREDPEAKTNVAADHPEEIEALRGRMLSWLADHDAPEEAIDALR